MHPPKRVTKYTVNNPQGIINNKIYIQENKAKLSNVPNIPGQSFFLPKEMGVEASIRHELKNQQKLALLMAPPDELHQVSVHKYKTAYDPNFIDKNSL